MVLSDQQLRQELISYGEVVPLISQRNRDQLHARLEVLRTQKSKKVASSPTRTRSTASPSRAAAASPSRIAASPTRRATASPSRSLATSSPLRTRSSITTSTGGSGRTTRTKQTPNLIELSDSDAESTARNTLTTRSNRTGPTTPQKQTRGISLRSQGNSSPSTSSTTRSPGKVTDDVEESIARHRREIKQLLDSARSRDRVTDTRSTSTNSRQQNKSNLLSSPTRTRRESSKSDDEERKSSSSPKRTKKSSESFWKRLGGLLKTLTKIFIASSILFGLYYLVQNSAKLFPPRQGISCSIQNVTECQDMKPVVDAVRKQLQVRTGEVDCGFREKKSVLIPREEIERYLNERGLKFNLGDQERWQALLKYIKEKPVSSILMWTEQDQQTNNTQLVRKLSTKDAIRSLTCRARQDVSKTLRNLMLVVLGSTGLLTLAWFCHRQTKNIQENERTFKNYFDKAMKLLEDQYEKHVRDPHTQPWLAISHIREKLFPEHDEERIQHIWERVKNEISKQKTRISSELQDINGKKADVWRWIKSAASSPKKTRSNVSDETDDYTSSDAGLTECLKLRHCFRSEDHVDDGEIDNVVDRIQERCANIKRIDHVGIHEAFVYLKFSSKEAAAQGYHVLNNWKYQNRHINVKYIRLNRYHEHFPEAKDLNNEN